MTPSSVQRHGAAPRATHIATAVAIVCALVSGLACNDARRIHHITVERGGGTVDVFASGDRWRAEIRSPRGIGAATIPLTPNPPRALELMFDLQALERLQVTCGTASLDLQINSRGEVLQSTTRPAPRTLAPGDSLWLPVQIERGPQREGAMTNVSAIRIDASALLRASSCSSLGLDWVDFFR